jgi:hypothetical protein
MTDTVQHTSLEDIGIAVTKRRARRHMWVTVGGVVFVLLASYAAWATNELVNAHDEIAGVHEAVNQSKDNQRTLIANARRSECRDHYTGLAIDAFLTRDLALQQQLGPVLQNLDAWCGKPDRPLPPAPAQPPSTPAPPGPRPGPTGGQSAPAPSSTSPLEGVREGARAPVSTPTTEVGRLAPPGNPTNQPSGPPATEPCSIDLLGVCTPPLPLL